jgi:hypothetical protein
VVEYDPRLKHLRLAARRGRAPSATIDGDRVTLHNIRNFVYRTATDFTPRHDDKTFDLQHLESVDLINSYWAGEAMAHLFVSFGFGGQDYVAISIETRKEQTEDYSSIKGFCKQYELIYVVADEREVIRLRTTYRQPPESVPMKCKRTGHETY